MPRRVIGRELSRGTICRDHWRATVTLVCADVLPAGTPSPLLLSVSWRERDEDAPAEANSAQTVRLELAPKTGSSLGTVAFDPADGAGPVEVVGNVAERLLLLHPATTATSTPTSPDVSLMVTIAGGAPVTIDLTVAPASAPAGFHVVAEGGGTAPAVLAPTSSVRLTTAARPAGGSHRWVVSPGLEIRGSATGDLAEVAAHFPAGGIPPLRVWALFGPAAGDGPVSQAAHLFQPGAVRVRLTARIRDLHPTAPATEELVPGARLEVAGSSALSGDDGRVSLDAYVAYGDSELRVDRAGITPRVFRLACAGSPGAPATVTITDPADGDRELARVTAPPAAADATEAALGDLPVVVHKVRGVVRWPDSRVTNDPNYRGTPLAGRRVWAVPVADGAIPDQRPADTRAWSRWKTRPDAIHSHRPGRAAQDERTAADGAWELRFIDLSAGKRWFIWIESADPDQADDNAAAVESPEYVVKTFYAQLRRLGSTNIGDQVPTGYHLIDHTHNLTSEAVRWGVDTLAVEEVETSGTREPRAFRPVRGGRTAFETDPTRGERVTLDAARRVASGFDLQVLPLVPIHEAGEARGAPARLAREGFLAETDTAFARGYFADAVGWVLDARRIDTGINLAAGTWEGAWSAAAAEQSRHRRRCELLEKTRIVSPQLPSASLPRVEDARWHFDAITLADFARITPPPASPSARARIGYRKLEVRWVPVLAPVTPRLVALAAGRHLYLAPGHGFFARPANPSSAAPGGWGSERDGWDLQAGEDDNDLFMATEVDRIARRNGMQVTPCRELRDFTLPGVTHPAAATFTPSANRDFPRLCQQNPIYFLGVRSPAVLTPAQAAPAGKMNEKARSVRAQHAAQLAAGATPIDAFLAIHTNGTEEHDARGSNAFYADVETTPGSGVEANTLGQSFANRIGEQLAAWAGIEYRGTRNLRQLGGNADVQNTFDHFHTNEPAKEAQRALVQPPGGGWLHQSFPRRIPASLVEVLYHDQPDDAALLTRAWFRRLAGEALAMAVEAQFRAAPAQATRAEVVRMLAATFGPTAATGARVSDATAIGAELAAYILAATGETLPAVDAPTLNAAVDAVDEARIRYTRRALAEAIRDAFAAAAGYAAGTPELGRFVTAAMTGEPTLDSLSRPAAPPTRDDAGAWVALALGLTPATAATLGATQVGGTILFPAPGGAPHADKYVPRSVGTALADAIRARRAQDLVRVTELAPANEGGVALTATGTPPVYSVARGQELTFTANLAGIVPRALAESARFIIEGTGGFRGEVHGTVLERSRLLSGAWRSTFPAGDATREYTLRVVGQDPGAGEVEFARRTLSVRVEG